MRRSAGNSRPASPRCLTGCHDTPPASRTVQNCRDMATIGGALQLLRGVAHLSSARSLSACLAAHSSMPARPDSSVVQRQVTRGSVIGWCALSLANQPAPTVCRSRATCFPPQLRAVRCESYWYLSASGIHRGACLQARHAPSRNLRPGRRPPSYSLGPEGEAGASSLPLQTRSGPVAGSVAGTSGICAELQPWHRSAGA